MPAAPRAEEVPGDGESSAGQDGASDGASDSDSDSGESLFFTQRAAPEAASSRNRKGATGGTRSLLDSSMKAKSGKNLRFGLPKYSFNLRTHSPSNLTLTLRQNIEMHSAVIGGFFTCVRDLWAGDVPSPLPTVDMEGDSIAPISEGEETEDEHIRIVQKKCLLVSSKPKRRCAWYDPQRAGGRVEPLRDKGPEASRGGAHPAPHTGSSQIESSGGVLCKAPASRGAFLVQAETSKAKNNKVFEQEEKANGSSSDSDATFCEQLEENAQKIREASPDRPQPHTDVSLMNTLSRRQEGARATKGQRDLVCSESRAVKKKNRHRLASESTEELFQSQEELRRGQSVLVHDTLEDSLLYSDAQKEGDVLVSKQKKKNRCRLDSENTEELFESQEELHSGPTLFVDETPEFVSPTIDEVDILPHGDAKNEGDVPDSKQQNIKKKKNRRRGDRESTEEETSSSGQPVHVEETPDPLAPIAEVDTLSHCGAEGEGDMPDSRQRKKKKKKKNRHSEDSETELLQTAEVTADLHGFDSVIADGTSDPPPTVDEGEAQKEGDIPESKGKKKKKKTKKSARADADIREVDGHVESDVRVEENLSVSSSCCTEEGGKKKKKKRKRKDEEALQVHRDEAAELHENMRASNATSEQTSTEQIDESRDFLEPSEVALGVSESRQRKKKKKHRSVCDYDSQGGEDGGEVSSSCEGISLGESQELPVKKRKRTSVNGGVTLNPQEENTQETAEGAKEQDTELRAKKKKKQQTPGAPSPSISSDTVEQSDDSVSVRKKEKRSGASFPAADAEQSASESAAIGGSSTGRDEVRRKKKKKKKVSECAADAEFCQTDEDAAVRKRKKKPGGEVEPAESERVASASDPRSSPTPRKKGPTPAADKVRDASGMEAFSPSSHVDQDEVKEERKRKKKMNSALPEDKSFSSETGAARKKKAAWRDSPHADGHRNSRRTLHNPHTDFLLAS